MTNYFLCVTENKVPHWEPRCYFIIFLTLAVTKVKVKRAAPELATDSPTALELSGLIGRDGACLHAAGTLGPAQVCLRDGGRTTHDRLKQHKKLVSVCLSITNCITRQNV